MHNASAGDGQFNRSNIIPTVVTLLKEVGTSDPDSKAGANAWGILRGLKNHPDPKIRAYADGANFPPAPPSSGTTAQLKCTGAACG